MLVHFFFRERGEKRRGKEREGEREREREGEKERDRKEGVHSGGRLQWDVQAK